MWIMTQTNKGLINTDEVKALTVENNLGKKKSCIMVTEALITLGCYDNEKIALDELDNIKNAIINGERFYQMR